MMRSRIRALRRQKRRRDDIQPANRSQSPENAAADMRLAPMREGGGAGGGAVRSAVARVPRFKAEQKTTIIIAMLIIA